jgi:hypothetical protein
MLYATGLLIYLFSYLCYCILIGHYALHDKLRWPSHRFNSNETNNCNNDDGTSDNDNIKKGVNMKGLFSIPLIERYSNGNVILPPKEFKLPSQ